MAPSIASSPQNPCAPCPGRGESQTGGGGRLPRPRRAGHAGRAREGRNGPLVRQHARAPLGRLTRKARQCPVEGLIRPDASVFASSWTLVDRVGGNWPDRDNRLHFLYPEKRQQRNLAMTVIELPDDQAAALKTKAAAQGLTLEAWFEKLSGVAVPTSQPGPRRSRYSLAELMAQCDANSPLSAEDHARIDAPAIGREA